MALYRLSASTEVEEKSARFIASLCEMRCSTKKSATTCISNCALKEAVAES